VTEFIKPVLDCDQNIETTLDTKKPGVEQSIARGIMIGYCPILKKHVTFGIGSLMGAPLNVYCLEAACEHNAQYGESVG